MNEIRARVHGGRIYVKSPFEAKSLAKSIPGFLWAPESKEWHYPATAISANSIFGAYTEADFEIACDRAFLELCAKADDAISARALKTRTDLPEIVGKFCSCEVAERIEDVPFCLTCGSPFESWTHQRQAFYFAREQSGAMLAVGMGGGKSKTAVSLLEDRDAKRVLIVCPKNVVDVWPKEFGKHATQDWTVTRGEVISTRTGKPKKNVSIADRAISIEEKITLATHRDAPIAVVVNYEAAWQGTLGETLLSYEWDAIVLDESHRIKAPGGAASKFCARLRDRGKWRLCLTGTPQPHSPLDIYAQARFIDPGVFGTNFARFRKQYACLKEQYVGGGRTVTVIDTDAGENGYQNLAELTEKIASFAFIIEQEELDSYLGLPETFDAERNCVLSAKAAKLYSEIWNEFAVDLEEGVVEANNVLTRLLRVQQITSGHLPVEIDGNVDDRKVIEIDTAKKDLLADVLDDIPENEPVVVFARFTHDLDQIADVAKKAGLRYGELSGRSRSGMTDEATMRENVDLLGVQIQAGGVGIDLTRAAHAIYFSLGFNLGDYLQSRKRVHRPGQSKKTAFVHLIAQGTVDEVIYATLARRKEVVDAVIKAAKAA